MKKAFIPSKKKFLFKGVVFQLYSIGWLAYLCHRTQRSIRRWENWGVLPKPIFEVKDGRRWYSASELIGYAKIVRESGVRPGKKSLDEMKMKLHEYRFNLKRLFLTNLDKVRKKLPDEFGLRELMSMHRERYWKEEAGKLLKEVEQ